MPFAYPIFSEAENSASIRAHPLNMTWIFDPIDKGAGRDLSMFLDVLE